MKDPKKDNPDLDVLAEKLRNLKKPSLDEIKKENLKFHILAKLKESVPEEVPFSLMKVRHYVRLMVERVDFSSSDKARIREKVYEFMETKKQQRFFWSDLFSFGKRAVAACLLIFVFFGFFSFMKVSTFVVRAESFTKLDTFFGEVVVERDGEKLSPYQGMEMREKDKIITGKDGYAIITYFDDSVSRLSSGSEVIIESLTKDLSNPLFSYIEMDLIDGSMWSKVLNLVGDDSSFVVGAKQVEATAKRAAFNIEVDDEKVEIQVYSNNIELKGENSLEKIVSGNKAVVEEKSLIVIALNEDEKSEDWVQKNLENDKQYLIDVDKRLLAARMEAMGVDSEGEFSVESSFAEDLNLFLTFDDVSKKKKELDLKDKTFIKAQVKLFDLDLSEQEQLELDLAITEFVDEMKGFKDFVDEIALTDKEYAEELRAYMQEKISAHKKDLKGVLPESPLYEVKEVVAELELLFVENESELVALKTEKALDKLAEAEDISVASEPAIAEVLVEKSKEEITTAIEIADGLEGGVVADMKEVSEAIAEAEKNVEKGIAGVEISSTVIEEEEVVEEVVVEEKYGVTIEGDKALSPLLEF